MLRRRRRGELIVLLALVVAVPLVIGFRGYLPPWMMRSGVLLAGFAGMALVAMALYRRMTFGTMLVRAAYLICPDCGYDLRGNPSGRCSECGRPFTPEELKAQWRAWLP